MMATRYSSPLIGSTVAHSSFHRTRSRSTGARHGAWLGLFAMWMIFVGPLISQTLPSMAAPAMTMSMSMPMGVSMSMGRSLQASADSSHDHDHGQQGELHALWEKCGYCSLLFHSPAAGNTSPTSLFTALAPATAAVPRSLRGHRQPLALFIAGPRAPPALYLG
jgi:hypothetical protein